MAKIVNVDLDIRTVEVAKQGFLTWGEIASKIDVMMNDFISEIDGANETTFGSAILRLVRKHIPTVIEVLEIATPLTRSELEKDVDPSEILDLVYAVIEVNGLYKASDRIKKIKALFK